MSYDEIEIEDMNWNTTLQAYTYPCPCGDLFQITLVGRACIQGKQEKMGDVCRVGKRLQVYTYPCPCPCGDLLQVRMASKVR